MALSTKKKTIMFTLAGLIVLTVFVSAYVIMFEKDSFVVALEQEGVLIDEVKDEILATAKALESKVESGEITEDEMKIDVQRTLTEALRKLVSSEEITQREMTDQMESYYESTGGIDSQRTGDLAEFCERINSGEARTGMGGSMGGGDKFAQMQSLCSDNIYTDEEIAIFNDIQSQRGSGSFSR